VRSNVHNNTEIDGPPYGVIKVYWDATIDKLKKKKMRGCVIVSDRDDNVLATICFSKLYIINPTVAEQYEVQKTLKFNRDLGIFKISY